MFAIIALGLSILLLFLKKKININYKWPNDILLNKKKIGGILVETSTYLNKNIKWVILGVGFNLIKFPKLTYYYFI